MGMRKRFLVEKDFHRACAGCDLTEQWSMRRLRIGRLRSTPPMIAPPGFLAGRIFPVDVWQGRGSESVPVVILAAPL
jgi:hypothetical protein